MNRNNSRKVQIGAASAASQSKTGSNLSTRMSKSARRRRNKGKNRQSFGFNASSVGSAVYTGLNTRMGVSDIRDLEIGYLAGYTYVGDGTLGVAGAIYYADPGKTGIATGGVPIVISDVTFGQSYIADIEKHFARKTFHDLRVHVSSLVPSTANSMVCNFAPHRGGDVTGNFVLTGTPAANSQAGVMGMQDQVQIASWQSSQLNMTNYIAGGSGALQNEFNIDNSSSAIGNLADITSLSPSGFYVSGSCSTTALYGQVIHAIIVTARISLLDFVGGIADAAPEIQKGFRVLRSVPPRKLDVVMEIEEEKFVDQKTQVFQGSNNSSSSTSLRDNSWNLLRSK